MKIHFGVDYYPEHWPEERWEQDAKLMKEMGIQVVRMAEFSWHKLEPMEGNYDFRWLDHAIELLGRYGIYTILGTPSAAPPSWLIYKNREILPVDKEGRVREFGGRHHDCQSNKDYRKYIRKIVTEMVTHYAANRNVIGWQPDNELGNSHQELCMCASCQSRFQEWLAVKYENIETLNEAWGNAFWSQEYNDFKEINAPRITVTGENPSLMLDWKRFHSDLIVDFFQIQAEIIRKHCPNQFITHNFMGFADTVDYYDLAQTVDFVSHDQYPGGFYAKQPHEDNHILAATLDVVRSYKNRSYWIMEQQSGITGWQIMGRAPKPGQLTAWAMQSIAHGGDTIVYFRWRVCAIGTEQYWHGILPHSGLPGRRYEELKQLSQTMDSLMGEMEGALPESQVGIVFSFEQLYAFQIQPQNAELDYLKQVLKYYKVFYNQNISVDFVPVDGDFSKYKLLIAPLQYLMSSKMEDKYFKYTSEGGNLVLTMRTGVKNESNICMTDRNLPGRLSNLIGAEIVDYDCLMKESVKVQFNHDIYDALKWVDVMQTYEKTNILATFAEDFYAGEACITENTYGDGLCYYVGTEPDEELMKAFVKNLVLRCQIRSLGNSSLNVELVEKVKENSRWLFAINHAYEAGIFDIPDGYEQIRGTTPGKLEAFEVQIFRKKES